MAANIIHKRLNVLLALLILGIGFVVTYGAAAEGNKQGTNEMPSSLSVDRRYEQLGTWNCSGVTTFPYGTERPYYGMLQNDWALDQQWLFMRFTEQQPITPKPFIEDQYWGYTAATGKHMRTIMANDGSFGALASDGWQGDVMLWQGTYTTGGMSYVYEERIERQTAERYRWYGTIEQNDMVLGMVDLTCKKQ